jgi:hypothetical protein
VAVRCGDELSGRLLDVVICHVVVQRLALGKAELGGGRVHRAG